jgi:ribosome maturation factor RimP
MISKKKIETLVDEHLEGTDRFVVDIKVSPENLIQVFIDADSSVTIDHCVRLSRHIEGNLDRDVEDFELRVMSAGADRPFAMLRQYKKNIGRRVEVVTNEESVIRGELKDVSEDEIVIRKEKEIKKGRKKSIEFGDEVTLPFNEIKQTKVIISF